MKAILSFVRWTDKKLARAWPDHRRWADVKHFAIVGAGIPVALALIWFINWVAE